MSAHASVHVSAAIRMARPWVYMALCCATSACTFPDVTYTDGGVIPPCGVQSSCANKAASCGNQAQNARDACEQQNCGGSSCQACTMQFEADIAVCVSECEACGKLEGCSNPTDDCKTLANNP